MKKLYEHVIVCFTCIIVIGIFGFIFITFPLANLIAAFHSNVNVYVDGSLKYSGNSLCAHTSSAGNNTRVSIGKRWSGCILQKALYVSSDVVIVPVAEDVDER
jgi:hypothetical protein